MKITIRVNGTIVKLDKDQSKVLMDALYQFSTEHWNDNCTNNNELNTKLGLIQWIGNIFQD